MDNNLFFLSLFIAPPHTQQHHCCYLIEDTYDQLSRFFSFFQGVESVSVFEGVSVSLAGKRFGKTKKTSKKNVIQRGEITFTKKWTIRKDSNIQYLYATCWMLSIRNWRL